MATCDRSNRAGFTLIELLVVLSIMALLAGLAMPLIGIARRSGAIANTQALQAKVLTALELFRGDVGAYPYLASADTLDSDVGNRLAYHLAHDMDDTEQAALAADLQTVRSAYSASGSSTLAITQADLATGEATRDWRDSHADQANRLAATRTRVAVLAGNMTLTGFRAPSPNTFDRTGVRALPTPTSLGWASDYLSRDLTNRERDVDAGDPSNARDGRWRIIDRWSTPLIYVNPVTPGVQPTRTLKSVRYNTSGGSSPFRLFPVERYGLGAVGRLAITTASDPLTTHALPTLRFAPEVWSAGPDRTWVDARNDAMNRDAIPASPAYRKGLP